MTARSLKMRWLDATASLTVLVPWGMNHCASGTAQAVLDLSAPRSWAAKRHPLWHTPPSKDTRLREHRLDMNAAVGHARRGLRR